MTLFNEADLRSGPVRFSQTKAASSQLSEAAAQFSEDNEYDIFLSHRKLDADLILRLKRQLENARFSVYIDWIEDRDLNRENVTKENARRLRKRMDACKCLLYARTLNSDTSVWMPWELGYFDGRNGRAAILPIAKDHTNTDGYSPKVAYLGLYPYLSKTLDSAGKAEIWVNETESKYTTLSAWIRGFDPRVHS